MKTSKLSLLAICLSLAFACKDGYIDDISRVAPGNDVNAPVVSINYPASDVVIIPFTETETDQEIRFQVADDIELKSVILKLNGDLLVTYSDFTDYRRIARSFVVEGLQLGDHLVEVVAEDLSGKTTTSTFEFELSNVYVPKYDGEIFYMPFEGNSYFDLITQTAATPVGSPTFVDGKSGKGYAGATDSYLTFATAPLNLAEVDSFSVAFWYKVNTTPDRAGIFVISPPGNNVFTSGIRFFREGGANVFKSNLGNGTTDAWNDGGALASADWSFIVISVGNGSMKIFLNGVLIRESSYTGDISWAGCDSITIGSGAPRFADWDHLSDLSLIDEIRLFNKTLLIADVTAMMND